MSLIRWFGDDLFNQSDRTQREFDRMINNMRSQWTGSWATAQSGVYPPINIYDDNESYILRAEIPGVEQKNLDISVANNTVTIRGKRDVEAEQNGSYHRRERSSGEFRRAFTLPEPVDSSKVLASLKNGLLEVRLPRSEEVRPKRIEIKAS